MLDSKIVELTNGLIHTKFTERGQRLQEDFVRAAQKSNASGMLNTSKHVEQVAELCRHEAKTRAWIVHHAHLRVLSELSVAPYPELSQDLKKRLSEFVSLGNDYARAPNELAHRIGLQSHPEYRIHEARERVLAQIGIEIDLFVERLTRQRQQRTDQTEGKPVYNFYSPIGAFQTGTGSTANVVQHFETKDREALQEALSAVREALVQLSESRDVPKKDLIELVDEARAEIAKPMPNRLKMIPALTTIGDTIRVLAAMNAAYQLLKIAALPFGITLP